MINIPAQLAKGETYEVHVLGSTPGVLLLHFPDVFYRFQCIMSHEVHRETSDLTLKDLITSNPTSHTRRCTMDHQMISA